MKTVLYTDVLYRAAELAGRPRDKLPVSEATMLQNSIAIDLQEVWNRAVWPELTPDPLNVTAIAQKFSKNEGVTGITLVNNDPNFNVIFQLTGNPGGTVVVNSNTSAPAPANANATSVGVQIGGGTAASANIPDAAHFSGTITWDGTNITFNATIEMGDILTVLTANPLATTRYRAIGFQEQDDAVWIDEPLASVWVEFVLPMPDLMILSGSTLNSYLIPQRFRNYLAFRGAGMLLGMDSQGASAGAMLALAETAMSAQLQRLPPPPDWRQVRTRTGFGRRKYTSNAVVNC